jgi:hypothetical protein
MLKQKKLQAHIDELRKTSKVVINKPEVVPTPAPAESSAPTDQPVKPAAPAAKPSAPPAPAPAEKAPAAQ